MIAESFAGLALLIWVYLLLGRSMFWRLREAEPVTPAAPPKPRVAIVIPARNEGASIGRTIASLAKQNYGGPVHIFLVDDHSQDGTADIARGAAQPDRLTVVRARPLPADWTGKLWALAEGVREAEGFHPDYFFFCDADIACAPEHLANLVALAESGGYDLASFMVRLACESFAESALIPAFTFFFFMLYPPRWIENRRYATAGAAGGSILLRAEALSRVGGIAAIRGELIDDCALAKAVKRAGGRVWLGITSQTVSIRSYGTFGEIGRMISRTAFFQLRHSALLLAGTIAGMFLTYMLPPVLLFSFHPVAAALGGAAWFLMALAYLPTLRFYSRSVLWAPFLPLVALFYTGATIHSAALYWSGRGGEWKGRTQDTQR
ncbi:MAG TPA: glycosyltransferase [Bryobacteraceae bacterium]|nr:glycosyltransferase [Bryobacteraceae bacterium]